MLWFLFKLKQELGILKFYIKQVNGGNFDL